LDVTERKQAEEALRESEKKYRHLFESILDVFYRTDNEGTLLIVSPSVEKLLGYLPNEVIGKKLSGFYINPEERDIFLSLLREKGSAQEFETPLRTKDGSVVIVSTNAQLYRDNQGNILGVQGISRDVTRRKQAEEQVQHILDSLRKAINTTIQVMVSAVEIRDPYTAGHQIRSAALARAIAAELGLPQEKIEGIHMVGTIHDIGKLSIPAEILSKPTKLTEIEFSLIKEHARRGFEMLKDVESPWPLAEIVYQHHERMDGSGYPRNLKGEDILIEARILTIADVVEAMSSHRPYRPGLGIGVALEEIEKNKVILYDADAVDVCLKLFREKRYELTQ
jgi:PAS domain S-box-containing protein